MSIDHSSYGNICGNEHGIMFLAKVIPLRPQNYRKIGTSTTDAIAKVVLQWILKCAPFPASPIGEALPNVGQFRPAGSKLGLMLHHIYKFQV